MNPDHLRLPLAAAALALCAGQALSDEGDDIAAGQALFLAHCAYCHGEDAAGDGPQAAVLNPQPKDLTRLAAEAGGTLPVARIVARIDGRDMLVAHGSPMPVFGAYFEGEPALVRSDGGSVILTSRPIADLLAWLATVQR